METNLTEIVQVLEKEKCSFHKYRAMVFVENQELRVIGCCKSFENFLTLKGEQLKSEKVMEMHRL